MNQSKYLKLIGKRLKCGPAKKKEIMKQIESDIGIAMENGKSFEDIMAEMGNPAEAAGEFNENFSEDEIRLGKRRKRFKTLGIVTGVLIVLAAGVFWLFPKTQFISEGSIFSEEEVTAKAKEIIALLDENDMEALTPLMTDAMKNALTQEMLQEIKGTFSADFGAFQSWGNAYVIEIEQAGQKTAVIEIVAVYENVTVTYQLSFDKDMKFGGLYMR